MYIEDVMSSPLLIVLNFLCVVLRLPENSPPALVYALDGCHAQSRRGRHQINLLNTIKSDLNLRGYSLDCIGDVYMVRDVVRDRKKWKILFENFVMFLSTIVCILCYVFEYD